jgi:hypothetical protein
MLRFPRCGRVVSASQKIPLFADFLVFPVLAVVTEGRAIIRRHRSKEFFQSFNSLVPAARAAYPHPAATESGGAMTFYDPTLYGRDEEEEFGDSGAYSESLEEDFEEEEEEEEEPGMPEPEAIEPEPAAVPAPPAPRPAAPAGGGGGGAKKKAAKKKPAKKKATKKPAKKAKKPAKKKAKKAAKKPAKKKGKKRR